MLFYYCYCSNIVRVATCLSLALMSAVLKMKPMFHFLSHNPDNLIGPSMSPQTTRLLLRYYVA